MRMVLPTEITTNQGSEFKNQLNDEMMTILNIRHHLIAAYHPQVYKIKRVGCLVTCSETANQPCMCRLGQGSTKSTG